MNDMMKLVSDAQAKLFIDAIIKQPVIMQMKTRPEAALCYRVHGHATDMCPVCQNTGVLPTPMGELL